VYAGVDYARVLERAQGEAEVLVWDGGNNDFPFFLPELLIVVADPLRAGDELSYHPGETNLRAADVMVINKVDSATPEQVEAVASSIRKVNPGAAVVRAESVVSVEGGEAIRNRRVLVIEDGPTLTHGGMSYGAGVVAARRHGAAEVVDPRPWAGPTLKEVYRRYPIGPVLPSMGYRPEQIAELEETINAVEADLVLVATPVDLRKVISIRRAALFVGYELREVSAPTLDDLLAPLLQRLR
ncbi:MAG: GTP-binding protein, partial [Actinomycetota bacterium]